MTQTSALDYKLARREYEIPFRRNGYKTSLTVDYDTYKEIFLWCLENFGDRYCARYHYWDGLADFQLFTRSDFTLFSISWTSQKSRE